MCPSQQSQSIPETNASGKKSRYYSAQHALNHANEKPKHGTLPGPKSPVASHLSAFGNGLANRNRQPFNPQMMPTS